MVMQHNVETLRHGSPITCEGFLCDVFIYLHFKRGSIEVAEVIGTDLISISSGSVHLRGP